MLMAQCTYTIWNNCMHTTFIFLSSGKIIVKKNPCIWMLLAYCNTTTYIKSNRPRHNGVFIKFHNTWQIFFAWKGSIARLNHHFKLWFFSQSTRHLLLIKHTYCKFGHNLTVGQLNVRFSNSYTLAALVTRFRIWWDCDLYEPSQSQSSTKIQMWHVLCSHQSQFG